MVLTCTGVSFFHGSNDGQKGMGLIMLILIGTVPTAYALNHTHTTAAVHHGLSADGAGHLLPIDRHAFRAAMAGLQAASDDLTAYLKTTGKLQTGPTRHWRQVPGDVPTIMAAKTVSQCLAAASMCATTCI